MTPAPAIVWFRQCLRLSDHSGLDAAARHHSAVIPLYIWSPEEEAPWPPGAASRWWLHDSLQSLQTDLAKRGSRLILAQGNPMAILRNLVTETGASAVYYDLRFEPAARQQEVKLLTMAKNLGIEAYGINTNLLFHPDSIQNAQGKPYRVFTAYWRNTLTQPYQSSPLPSPETLQPPTRWPQSLSLDALNLKPKLSWANNFAQLWQPGEKGAQTQLKSFISLTLANYDIDRNYPARPGTSRLSPHLHWGEVSPKQVWEALRTFTPRTPQEEASLSTYRRELIWREFAYHLLYHFPHTPQTPLKKAFESFPWEEDPEGLKAWQTGKTGYPIVDAGMRELWKTGWMHNRVRMIVGSFLVKDLLLPWQEGARWFWDTLVDADLANNTLGWQWISGCGADAAPYFRIFNPQTQGEKFDPTGAYVQTWVPELSQLPASEIHAPSPLTRTSHDYPCPIIVHDAARKRALAALSSIKDTQN